MSNDKLLSTLKKPENLTPEKPLKNPKSEMQFIV